MEKRTLLANGEILLYGDVGDPYGWGDGFSVTDVAAALAQHGTSDITVRINSGGGIAFDGVAIYSLLRSHEGKVHVIVDGIAASAASLIMMAGDTREVRDGAMVMIHDAAGVTFGTAAEHQRSSAVLDKLSDQYASIYATRAGIDHDEARELMRAETWFDANEAVAEGFATGTADSSAKTTASFDYRIYAHAPRGLPSRIKGPASGSLGSPPQMRSALAEPAPTKPGGKGWALAFFQSAERSALSMEVLNSIVRDAQDHNAARDGLIDAMAAAQNARGLQSLVQGRSERASSDRIVEGILAAYRKAGGRTRKLSTH